MSSIAQAAPVAPEPRPWSAYYIYAKPNGVQFQSVGRVWRSKVYPTWQDAAHMLRIVAARCTAAKPEPVVLSLLFASDRDHLQAMHDELEAIANVRCSWARELGG